jgi:hypothetical protein
MIITNITAGESDKYYSVEIKDIGPEYTDVQLCLSDCDNNQTYAFVDKRLLLGLANTIKRQLKNQGYRARPEHKLNDKTCSMLTVEINICP